MHYYPETDSLPMETGRAVFAQSPARARGSSPGLTKESRLKPAERVHEGMRRHVLSARFSGLRPVSAAALAPRTGRWLHRVSKAVP